MHQGKDPYEGSTYLCRSIPVHNCTARSSAEAFSCHALLKGVYCGSRETSSYEIIGSIVFLFLSNTTNCCCSSWSPIDSLAHPLGSLFFIRCTQPSMILAMLTKLTHEHQTAWFNKLSTERSANHREGTQVENGGISDEAEGARHQRRFYSGNGQANVSVM